MTVFNDLGIQIAGAVGAFTMGGDVLMLDTVIFDEAFLEVPESIGPLAGAQVIEEHRYPGGIITHQSYGAFPDHIEWRGLLTGGSAFNRMQQVDQIRIAGREVILRYGPKNYLGRVSHFEPTPHHAFLIPYRLRFMPRIDISSQAPGFAVPTPEQLVGSLINGLATMLGGEPFGLPTSMVADVTSFLSIVGTALSIANGVVASISITATQSIAAQSAAVTADAEALFGSTNPQVTFMARASAYYAQSISQAVTYPTQQQVTTLQLVNPNFPLLAAQYLGDATQWRDVAYFNGLTDPQPIGSFVIKIPSPSAAPVPPP